MAKRSAQSHEEILQKYQCTVQEVAVLIGWSPSRIYNLIHDRELPFGHYKLKGAVRFRVAEILEYLEKCRVDFKAA